MGWDGRSGCDGEPRWESCGLVTEDLDGLGGVRLSSLLPSLSLSLSFPKTPAAGGSCSVPCPALPCPASTAYLTWLPTYLASLPILPS